MTVTESFQYNSDELMYYDYYDSYDASKSLSKSQECPNGFGSAAGMILTKIMLLCD